MKFKASQQQLVCRLIYFYDTLKHLLSISIYGEEEGKGEACEKSLTYNVLLVQRKKTLSRLHIKRIRFLSLASPSCLCLLCSHKSKLKQYVKLYKVLIEE